MRGQSLENPSPARWASSPARGEEIRGFTLLEVLIVVLIIGVLASVALPQYQKAVLKSRYSAMMPIAKSLADGNEVYYMEHGNYSEDPTEMLIQGKVKYPSGTNVLLYDGEDLSYVRASSDNVPKARYLVYQKHSKNFADTTMCEAGDSRANELCQALGGKEVFGGKSSGESGWTAYLLSGNYSNIDTFGNSQANEGSWNESWCTEDGITRNITASKSGATGKAVCVNGKWSWEWSGGGEYNGGYVMECDGNTKFACAGANFIDDGYCYGKVAYACAGANYSYYSQCLGKVANACSDGAFMGDETTCEANAANACAGSTFSDLASCEGNVANGCSGTIISDDGYCYTAVAGGCDGAKYSGRGECTGKFCLDGTPAHRDNWHGGYCNPDYMVSGNCPEGSPKQVGNCWDGSCNEVSCLAYQEDE